MNIFPPKDCSWVKVFYNQKVVFLTALFLSINLSILFAQSVDDIQSSEISIQNTSEKSLRKMAKSFKSDAKIAFKNTLRLAQKNDWVLQKNLSDGRMMALQGIDEFENPVYYITHGQVSASACTRTNSLYTGGSLGVNISGLSSIVKDKLGIWGWWISQKYAPRIRRKSNKTN
jgi:hypothetical protein